MSPRCGSKLVAIKHYATRNSPFDSNPATAQLPSPNGRGIEGEGENMQPDLRKQQMRRMEWEHNRSNNPPENKSLKEFKSRPEFDEKSKQK